MDALLEFLYRLVQVFIYWRLSLSVGASIVAAFFLSGIIEWFTAGLCLTLVLFGTAFGLIWQGRADAGVGLIGPVPPISISRPVAGLGFAMIGFFLGRECFLFDRFGNSRRSRACCRCRVDWYLVSHCPASRGVAMLSHICSRCATYRLLRFVVAQIFLCVTSAILY